MQCNVHNSMFFLVLTSRSSLLWVSSLASASSGNFRPFKCIGLCQTLFCSRFRSCQSQGLQYTGICSDNIANGDQWLAGFRFSWSRCWSHSFFLKIGNLCIQPIYYSNVICQNMPRTGFFDAGEKKWKNCGSPYVVDIFALILREICKSTLLDFGALPFKLAPQYSCSALTALMYVSHTRRRSLLMQVGPTSRGLLSSASLFRVYTLLHYDASLCTGRQVGWKTEDWFCCMWAIYSR